MPFTDIVYESTVRVRYAETDASGLAHHAAYVPWLEIGRVEWLRFLGQSYASLERSGYHLAVVELHCRYVRPARFDDELIVRTAITRIRSRELSFVYEIVTADPHPIQVCNATSRHIWLRSGSIAKMPDELSRLIEASAHSASDAAAASAASATSAATAASSASAASPAF